MKSSRPYVIGVVLLLGAMAAFFAWPVIRARPVRSPVSPGGLGTKHWFARQYALDDGELVRFIPPPFLPERRNLFLRGYSNPLSVPATRTGTLWFHGPSLKQPGISSTPGTVLSSIMHACGLTRGQIEISPALAPVPFDGDWVIRASSTPDQRLEAVEHILRGRLHRDIHIDKRQLRIIAIVARGRWSLRPLPGVAGDDHLSLFVERHDGLSGDGAASASGFFTVIEELTQRRIIDQTGGKPREVMWRSDVSLKGVDTDPARLYTLLDNLGRQTSLTFTLEPCDASVYAVSEGRQKIR